MLEKRMAKSSANVKMMVCVHLVGRSGVNIKNRMGITVFN